MENLSYNELQTIDGGAPKVSNNGYVQGGYSVGYHIGRAIGQTLEDCASIYDKIKDWVF